MAPLLLAARDYPSGFPNALGLIQPVPATYSGLASSPQPGAVAGIVLGSVASFLLVLALLYTCCSFGPGADSTSSWAAASAVTLRASHRSRRRSRSRHTQRRHVSTYRRESPVRVTRETVEVLRTRNSGPRMSNFGTPVPAPDSPLSRTDTPANAGGGRGPVDDNDSPIIIDAQPPERGERSSRRASNSRPPGPMPPRANDDFSEDEIIVTEHHSPPPRARSQSKSNPSRRSGERRRSVVYRDVSRRESTSRR